MDLANPKRRSDGEGRWYPYYAGYSEAFVRDLLKNLELRKGALVLDPWNGSGTTTTIARSQGFAVAGFDLNPALVIVAKARLLDRTTLPSLRSITDEVVSNAAALRRTAFDGDPLLQWFRPSTAFYIRALEQSIYHLLIDHKKYEPLFFRSSFANVSSLAAFLYVALFWTVRSHLTPFYSSNPTWIRTASGGEELLSVPRRKLRSSLKSNVRNLATRIQAQSFAIVNGQQMRLDLGDSLLLPCESKTIDAIVTSPPYCTRIDYVVATLPELAVLGSPCRKGLQKLRDQMIGTPTVAKESDALHTSTSRTAASLLKKVRSHSSKASATYYLRQLKQYFVALSASMHELNRILKRHGVVTFVVQDSYYKNVHNDLARIVTEEAGAVDWHLAGRKDFRVGNPLRAIHVASNSKRRPVHATESVLVFRKR